MKLNTEVRKVLNFKCGHFRSSLELVLGVLVPFAKLIFHKIRQTRSGFFFHKFYLLNILERVLTFT